MKKSISQPFRESSEELTDYDSSWLCRSSGFKVIANRRLSTYSIYTIFEDDTISIPEWNEPADVETNFTRWAQGILSFYV
jgi:hypothetical protein